MSPGHDAVLRCEGHVPEVTFELLRVGETVASTTLWVTHPSADLVLTYVGPQHAGNYSCRYRSWWPKPFLSELSNPVELQVAGEVPLGSEGWVPPPAFAQTDLHWECPFPQLFSAHWLVCPVSARSMKNCRQRNTCIGPEAEWLGQLEHPGRPGCGGGWLAAD